MSKEVDLLNNSVPIDLILPNYLLADSTTRPLVSDLSTRYGGLRLVHICVIRSNFDFSYKEPFRGVYLILDRKLLVISLESGEHARDLQVFNLKDDDSSFMATYTHPDTPKPLKFRYNPRSAKPSVDNPTWTTIYLPYGQNI